MKRHYFISNDLEDLQQAEADLKAAGISEPQIHVLSEDDVGVAIHHLHQVEPVLKKDVVMGTERGAICGAIGAGLVLLLAWFSGLTATYTWVPAIFLAVTVLGFCTWEGGLIGIQAPHRDFQRFQDDLQAGRHIFFVDIESDQEQILQQLVQDHASLENAGEGDATPGWVVGAQRKWTRFLQLAP